MKKLKGVIFWILSLMGIIILSLVSIMLTEAIQEKLFLPQEYIIWIFNFPSSWLARIFKWYITFVFVYILSKGFRAFILWVIKSKESFMKRHKRSFIVIFVIFNIVLVYSIFYNVSVITNNKIIAYTFFSPQGKEYGYNDIVKIDTGVYGKKGYTHSKGDFYYIIQLNNGTKIDLTKMDGAKNDVDYRFVIEKLDSEFVNIGIPKVSSMDNFEYCTEDLDEIYADRIRNILLNVNGDN